MKKKIFLILSMLTILLCLLAFSANAQATNDFGDVESVENIDLTGMSEDTNARVVLFDETEYHTYPARYIVKSNSDFAVDFSKLNSATGKNYGVKSVIRIEIPLNVKAVTTVLNGGRGGKNLIQVVFPENSVANKLNWGAFEGCSALQSINIPASVESFGNNTFNGCTSLVDITFALDGKLKTLDVKAFASCTSLRQLILPRNLEKIGNDTFYNCKNLELLVLSPKLTVTGGDLLGAVGYNDANSCPVIYMPGDFATGEGSLASGNLFGRGNKGDLKKYVVFFTGTFEQAQAILNKYSADISLGDANIVAYDPNVTDPYLYLGKDPYRLDVTINTNRVFVYGYNLCDAFYNGVHSEGVQINDCLFGCGRNCGKSELLENPKHSLNKTFTFGENGYFSAVSIKETCANCNTVTIDETVNAIFEWKGYSKSTYGETYAVVQGFKINRDSLAQYKAYVPNFDFGIMATGNANGKAINPQIGDEKVFTAIFDNTVNDYYDIKVTGITEELMDKNIVFCIYVLDSGKMYYLDGEKTAQSVIGVSYNSISGEE